LFFSELLPSRVLTGAVDVGPLSMALNGTIDAAVNGGTQKYIEAFLTDEFKNLNADDEHALKQVHSSICN
jgi:hypothetical protein